MLNINADKIAQRVIAGLRSTMNEKKRTATGKSMASVYAEYDPGNMVIRIMGADHWKYIDKGTKPGGVPPLNRILEWCVARGIPKEAANKVRWAIFHNGAPKDKTKLNVVSETLKAVQPDIDREMEKELKASFEAEINPLWQSL